METDRQSSLGQRIARQRRTVCLTQAQLAERLNITQGAVARWESDNTVPALRHRLRLCQELMISPVILFAEDDDREAVA